MALLILVLTFSSLFVATHSQVNSLNKVFCYDDPRLEFVGFGTKSARNISEFAVSGIYVQRQIRGTFFGFTRGFYPITNVSAEAEDSEGSFPLNRVDIGTPVKTTIFVKGFLYFRATGNEHFRLLGFAQEFLGCPQPLCFSSSLDAANIYIESDDKYQLHVFRGKWMWDTSSPPLVHKAKMISERFIGMPDHIDAAFSIGSEKNFNLQMYFFKDEWVYVKLNNMWPQRFQITNMFDPLAMDTVSGVDSAFPDKYAVTKDTKAYIIIADRLVSFAYQPTHRSWSHDGKEVALKKELASSDAAFTMITSGDSNANRVYFFKSWWYRAGSMAHFPDSINKQKLDIGLSMEYPFRCPKDLYENKKLGIASIDDYKELYVNQLLTDHDRDLWRLIGVMKEHTKGYVMIAAVVLTLSFVIPIIAMFWFFLTAFQWRNKKERKPGFKKEITPSALLDHGFTPSQVVRAGIATPSTVGLDASSKTVQAARPSIFNVRSWFGASRAPAESPPAQQEKPASQLSKAAKPRTSTVSQLLDAGYSPSQLLDAGLATRSQVEKKSPRKKEKTASLTSTRPKDVSKQDAPGLSNAFNIFSRLRDRGKGSTKPQSTVSGPPGMSNVFGEISKVDEPSSISRTDHRDDSSLRISPKKSSNE